MQSRRDWLRSSVGLGGLILAPELVLSKEEIKKFNPRPLLSTIKLSSNENPYGPSELVQKAVIKAFDHGCRYPYVYSDALATKLAKKHLPAGLHPFDRTARPQIVHKDDNPEYHSLIKAFEKVSGVGALMNTSFNIHGESIVGSPYDAIDTFLRCGIHHLLIGDFFISKKEKK